jgi:hypothetical protein
MRHIIYSSKATQEPVGLELIVLVLQSRRNNERDGITGALVYGGGLFMQVIEGKKEAVTALYERICTDPRHQAIHKLVDKPMQERAFATWVMAFQKLSPEQVLELEGYSSPARWAQRCLASDFAEALLLQRLREVVLQGFNS